MKALVIGGGGREHALAWKLAASALVQTVFVAPGNAGTAREPKVKNVAIDDFGALADFARDERVDLTVVGPEAALAAGVVDLFQARGLRIFGPTRAAAQLESSKAFAKDFMRRHGIPTAGYAVFTDAQAAHAHVEAAPSRSSSRPTAWRQARASSSPPAAPRRMPRSTPCFTSTPGARVVIEEFLAGEEASFMVVCRGTDALALATSQDHKRLRDGDDGPNTGGMGAYSPAPVVTPTSTRASCARSSTRRWRAWPPRACRSTASSTPA